MQTFGSCSQRAANSFHPRIPDRKQFWDPGLTLPDQNFDRIGTIWGHLPFRVRAERHLPAPFGTLGASDPRVRRLTQNPFFKFFEPDIRPCGLPEWSFLNRVSSGGLL
jgi:hypothetical protein